MVYKLVKQTSNSKEMTQLYCPFCGKRSHIRVRWGQLVVFCRPCRREFEVIIRIADKKTDQLFDERGEQLYLNFG